LLDAQMNINLYVTKDYENIANWTLGENKANTKPIKANTKPIKANIKPKQTQSNPTCSELVEPISNPTPRRGRSGIFTFYFIRYTQYDIWDTQKHSVNPVNRSCFAEKA